MSYRNLETWAYELKITQVDYDECSAWSLANSCH